MAKAWAQLGDRALIGDELKVFCGTSENAVKTQIWIAVSVYVLVAILRKQLKLDASLYTLMQVFSVTVVEKASIEPVILQTADSSELVMKNCPGSRLPRIGGLRV